jgi:hypothetical protein
MSISLSQFQTLTFVIFFLYIFVDSKIFLALWAALFHMIQLTIRSIAVNTAIYRIVIMAYVITVLVGYLYMFRDVLISNKKLPKGKLEALSSDKKRQRRFGIAILFLIIINVVAVLVNNLGTLTHSVQKTCQANTLIIELPHAKKSPTRCARRTAPHHGTRD